MTFDEYCAVAECGKKIPNDISGHRCPYCNKWHCENHILAEDHNCPNPKTIPASYREIFSRGKRIIIGK